MHTVQLNRMRPGQFIILIAIVTCAALLYVHIQVEILKTSYSIRESESTLARLANENRSLEANCLVLKAPENVERILRENKSPLKPPREIKVVEMKGPERNFALASGIETAVKRLAGFFGIRAQAIAETQPSL